MAGFFVILSKKATLPQLQVTCVQDDAGANDYNGTYFLLDAPDGSQYYVWFDEDDGSDDPAINGRTGIEVDYSANDSAADIGDALQAAIDAEGDFSAADNDAGVVIISYTMWYDEGNCPCSFSHLHDADYDHADGWIGLRMEGLNDAAAQDNKIVKNASHESYRVVTGKFTQSMVLNGVFILNTNGSESSEYYNAIKEFLLRHMAFGSSSEYMYPVYLHIYNPALQNQRIQWMDNAETMQNYCKVGVTGFNFAVTCEEYYFYGKISLEECWT